MDGYPPAFVLAGEHEKVSTSGPYWFTSYASFFFFFFFCLFPFLIKTHTFYSLTFCHSIFPSRAFCFDDFFFSVWTTWSTRGTSTDKNIHLFFLFSVWTIWSTRGSSTENVVPARTSRILKMTWFCLGVCLYVCVGGCGWVWVGVGGCVCVCACVRVWVCVRVRVCFCVSICVCVGRRMW